MRLSDLLNKTAAVPVTCGDVTLTLQVQVGRFTVDFLGRLRDAGGEGWAVLAEVIVGSDLTDDSGAPLPITAQLLRDLPVQWLNAMAEAITESITPNSPSSSPSAPS